jgi:hypothetical protein
MLKVKSKKQRFDGLSLTVRRKTKKNQEIKKFKENKEVKMDPSLEESLNRLDYLSKDLPDLR